MEETAESAQTLEGWHVSKIEAVQNGRAVEIEFTVNGRSPFRFRTRKFGVGGRNSRTAALSRFAAKSGFGEVQEIFWYLRRMRRDHEGTVFPPDWFGRTLQNER